jgi:site-specific DNA-adenine methylase
MNYGLPYKGSKNRIAKRILEVLPPAPVLYDVFAGGCAITHAGLLSGKYSRVVANDINGMIPHAFETAITGGVTALFIGVLVMLAMGLAIAFFREMVL